MRDDFSLKTKQLLADRVAWICSMPGCNVATIGPGSKDDNRVSIGEAAHICAASPGGPRYDETMTSTERKHINNGIWLCSNHSKLVDKDPSPFSAETLRQWKKAAEEKARFNLGKEKKVAFENTTLLQLGFDIVVEAEWVSVTNEHEWSFMLHKFIYGDKHKLHDYCTGFTELNETDKFIAIETQGDGRKLLSAPNVYFDSNKIQVYVQNKFIATDPDKSGRDLALGEDGDIFLRNGDIAMVEGLDCAKQNLRIALSTQKGEWFLDRNLGSVFGKYFCDFMQNEFMLTRLFRLEVSRLSSVTYEDGTPRLPMIKQINDVDVVEIAPYDNKIVLSIRVEWGNGVMTVDNYRFFVPRDKAQYQEFIEKEAPLLF